MRSDPFEFVATEPLALAAATAVALVARNSRLVRLIVRVFILCFRLNSRVKVNDLDVAIFDAIDRMVIPSAAEGST
jgi:hypothetical protein